MGEDGVKKFLERVKSALGNFLYNEDRAVNSLAGHPAQETISSDIGRDPGNKVYGALGGVLDKIQPDHIKNAVKHANALDAADDGFTG